MSDDGKADGVDQQVETVLIVDAEILVRMAIAQYLRDCGFRVIEAMNGDEAMIVLEKLDISVHAVLSDTQMPGNMDGFGLAKWIREHRPSVPVILVGSPASAANAAANLCEGGPILAKPYEPQLLVDKIRQMLASAMRSSPSL